MRATETGGPKITTSGIRVLRFRQRQRIGGIIIHPINDVATIWVFTESNMILIPARIMPRFVIASGLTSSHRADMNLLFSNHNGVGSAIDNIRYLSGTIAWSKSYRICRGWIIRPLRYQHSINALYRHACATITSIITARTGGVNHWLPA